MCKKLPRSPLPSLLDLGPVYFTAVSLFLDPRLYLLDVPPAHHPPSLVLLEGLPERKGLAGLADAILVVVGETLIGWKTPTGCGAILK